MTYLPRVAATNDADWADLLAELDRWDEAGRGAALWWRDDDAVAPSPALDRLLAAAAGTPLGLAVVPANARPELATRLAAHPAVAVLHHGWCHANRAAGDRKSEYPPERHPVDVADELDEGRQRLRALFGARALPIFVPPWNRFAPRFAPLLAEAGLTTLSQLAPRREPAPPGLAVADVHLDLVAWRTTRRFIGEAAALTGLIGALRDRRQDDDDATAVGILTHHLVMDAATEDFVGRLGEIVAAHAGACWRSPGDLAAAPPGWR